MLETLLGAPVGICLIKAEADKVLLDIFFDELVNLCHLRPPCICCCHT